MNQPSQPEKFYVGVKGLIVQEGKLLLLKKSERSTPGQRFWDLPGGRIDHQEKPLETLKRELQEELVGIKRIKVKNLIWAYRVPYLVEDQSNLFLIYYLVEADVSQTKLSPEHVEKKWVGVEQFDQLDAPVDANFAVLLKQIIEEND